MHVFSDFQFNFFLGFFLFCFLRKVDKVCFILFKMHSLPSLLSNELDEIGKNSTEFDGRGILSKKIGKGKSQS